MTVSDKSMTDESLAVSDESAASTETHGVIMTEAASAKAKALLDQEGRDDLALRISVQPGGCSGLRYNLFFDDRALDGDLHANFGGVRLTVDRMSAPYVQGATIDLWTASRSRASPSTTRMRPGPAPAATRSTESHLVLAI